MKDSEALAVVPPQDLSVEEEVTEEEKGKILEFFPAIVDVPILPEAGSMPLYAVAIVCLRACGMSIRDMASAMKISKGSVQWALVRYDPDGKFALGPEQITAVPVAFVRSKRLAALAHITDEKLRQAPAKDLAHIASRLWEQEADMTNDSGPVGKKRGQDDLLKRVRDATG